MLCIVKLFVKLKVYFFENKTEQNVKNVVLRNWLVVC
jgi:hypothetical protein